MNFCSLIKNAILINGTHYAEKAAGRPVGAKAGVKKPPATKPVVVCKA